MDSISLAYAYGWKNAGDMAINQGSITFLNELLPATRPQVVSLYPERSPQFEETERQLSDDLRFELVGGPMRYDPKSDSSLERLAGLAGDGLRYASDRLSLGSAHEALETRMAAEITRSDVLFYNGGNLLHGRRGLPYLLGVLYPLQIARQRGVPYGLLPHTIFDIEGRYESLLRSVLEDSAFVWTRDRRSYEYLTEELDLSCPVRNGLDTAFFLDDPSPEPPQSVRNRDGPARIAVVPRFSTLGDTGSLPDQRDERAFTEGVIDLAESGHDVTLTVQTKVEEEWVTERRSLLESHGVDVFRSYDTSELRSHYREQDLVVTMRLHAGILALASGTPTIGLYREEWGPKTPGTWENVGIGDYAYTCDGMSAETFVERCDRGLDAASSLRRTIARTVTERKSYMLSETRSLLDLTVEEQAPFEAEVH